MDDTELSVEERLEFITVLERSISKMLATDLLAEKNKDLLWRNRVMRLCRYHYKYLLFLLSKIYPFTFSIKTFFGLRLFFLLPEQYYFLLWGFFPEIDKTAEANLTKFLIKNLREGDVFFDVGANCGFYTVLARCFVGHGGAVHAFEPTKTTFHLLQKTKGDYKNIYLNNVAVYDQKGYIDFYLNEFSVGNTAVVPDDKNSKKIIVETLSLDEYCEKGDLVPTFIKIDVEGSEERVIAGAQRILKKHSPLVAMEIWNNNEIYKNAFTSLVNLGYTPYWIDSLGTLIPATASSGAIVFEECFKGNDTGGYENLIFKK